MSEPLTKEERKTIIANCKASIAELADVRARWVGAIEQAREAGEITGRRSSLSDAARLDWLEKSGKCPRRCVEVSYHPQQGLMPSDKWCIHFNGIGTVSYEPTLRGAIDAAIAASSLGDAGRG